MSREKIFRKEMQIWICRDEEMKKQTIEEACTLHARIGWQGLTKAEYLDSGDYYLVTGVDFSDGLIDFEHCHYVTQDRYEQDEHIQLKADDVLVTKDGTIGKVAIIECLDKPATLNSGVFVVRPKNKSSLLPEYLVFSLRSGHFSRFIEQIKVGCTIAHLNQAKFLKYEIPDISVEEQQHVIDILKRAETVVKASQEELRKLDELIKARFVELFSETYEEVSAEDVCSEIVDCPHSTPKYDESELIYPAIRTSEIQNGSISWNSMKYVGAIEYEKRIKRLKPVRGDIVYAREGTYGDCVILPDEHEFCLGQRTMLFRPNFKICTSAYLHAALRSDAVKKQADESNAGSTVPHVNVADAKKFHFPLPPLELQQQFTDFVIEVNKSKVAVQKALDETQLLFDSLMQEYFG